MKRKQLNVARESDTKMVYEDYGIHTTTNYIICVVKGPERTCVVILFE